MSPDFPNRRRQLGESNGESVVLLSGRGDYVDRPGGVAGAVKISNHSAASDELGDRFERPDGSRKGYALELAGKRHQPVDSGNEMHATLAVHYRLNFIEDHGSDICQHGSAPVGA